MFTSVLVQSVNNRSSSFESDNIPGMGRKHKQTVKFKQGQPADAAVSAQTAVAGPKPRDKRLLRFTTVTTLKAAFIIAVLGVVVFFSGLSSPFLGDDWAQIVNN